MKWLLAGLVLAYPLLVFLGLKWFDARVVGALLGVAGAARLWFARARLAKHGAALVAPLVVAFALLVALAALSNDPRYVLALPVLINAALLCVFGVSLRGTPIVETFARLQTDELSARELAYCRSVTKLWCAFFVLNGAVIGALALRADTALWAWYTGCASYLLIGLVFASEYVYRHYRFRRYLGAFTDPLLRRIFPPDGAAR